MPAKASWAVTRPRSATISTNAPRVFRWLRSVSTGPFLGCTSIRANYHQGNIYRDRFWDVWQNRFEPFRDREWARRGECADCSMFRYCQGGGMHLRGDDGELLYCHYHRL